MPILGRHVWSPEEKSPNTNTESNQPSPLPWSRYPAPVVPRQETVLGTASLSIGPFPDIDADEEADSLIGVLKSQMAAQFPFVVSFHLI